MYRSQPLWLLATFVLAVSAGPVAALQECRLLRQPDIEGERIVFVYAGDLWTVSRRGGVASRLTAHEGLETFPKLSPDGRTVAFTGNYDGNTDAFTMSVDGGEPVRQTWHPSGEQVAEWYPDGKALLLRSQSHSSMQRFSRFFRLTVPAGFPELLPLPTAGYATFAPGGERIAYVAPSYDNRTWKRYEGGNAPNIWTYDFARNVSDRVTEWKGSEEWPMWYRDTVYYCSDRDGKRANLWAWDARTREHRQVTQFTEYDVKWPSIGSDAIVFENGGALWVLDLPAEQGHAIEVLVPDDKPATRPEYRNVAKWTEDAALSPNAKRVVVAARGELFTVPAEKGDVRNLTNTPGSRERDPIWSPDGKWIAYFSDKSGEYELHVIGSDGKTPDRQVTSGADTYRFRAAWSPDSKKLAFNDKRHELWWCDVANGKTTRVDKSEVTAIDDFAWSPDSRWIAYSSTALNGMNEIRLHELGKDGAVTVSTGMFDDFSPTFDPKSRWLYFLSRRTLEPEFGAFEFDFQFRATDKIYAVTLQDTLRAPLPPESDEETGDAAADDGDGEDEKNGKDAKKSKKKKGDDAEAGRMRVDRDGIAMRVAEMPLPPARYAMLVAAGDKLVFSELDEPDPESDDPPTATVHCYVLEKRKDQVVIEGVKAEFAISKDGGKLLYHGDDTFGIVETGDAHDIGDGKIAAGTLQALVDPRAEWKQMFEEAWRLERDFYYDPNLGGIDWTAIGARYRSLLPHVAHRHDLNYILGELVGELGTSHAYVGGGEYPDVAKVPVGLLGVDWALDARSGRYRFDRIYHERDWNSATRAPLGEPGVQVKPGDYLLAVNGRAVQAPDNVYAAFIGSVDRQTTITVGRSPDDKKPRTYTVQPIDNEQSLRYTAWVNDNRRKVEQATGGRIAYVHLPNTATAGVQEFAKQFFPQVDKQGLIVDERFNGGGFVPDFLVERMARRTWVYWSNRDGTDFRTPSESIDGPKCMVANEYAGSGGDCLPYYFRLAGIGPVIGKRTWGGLVGISQNIPLMDGGVVTMPDFGMWDPQAGGWVVENHGVDPDIEVENVPADMVSGRDAQLERAIQWCLSELEKRPAERPARPAYKVRVDRR
jgi:tricorn protease